MIIQVGPNQDVILVLEGSDPGIIINRDLTTPIYYGTHPGFVVPNEASVIDPLTFVQYSGDANVLARSGGSGFVQVDVQPNAVNWTPSPVQSAQALIASGLMLDATGQKLLSTGVPPFIPGAFTENVFGKGASITTFYTFLADSRIWVIDLTFAVSTNASYAVSVTQLYACIRTGSGLAIPFIELSVSAPSQNDSGHKAIPIGGLPVLAGDTLILDVNNNVSLGTGGVMRASGAVMCSTP